MVLWFSDGYEKYAVCIGIVSLMSVFSSLYDTITNINSIRELAKFTCPIRV